MTAAESLEIFIGIGYDQYPHYGLCYYQREQEILGARSSRGVTRIILKISKNCKRNGRAKTINRIREN